MSYVACSTLLLPFPFCAEAASAVNFKLVLQELGQSRRPLSQSQSLRQGLSLSHRPGQLMSLLGYPPAEAAKYQACSIFLPATIKCQLVNDFDSDSQTPTEMETGMETLNMPTAEI